MSEAIELRPASPEDLEPLFELHRTVFRGYIERLWGWEESWQRSNFQAEFEASSTWIVELDDRPIGFLQTDRNENRIFLRNIALLPELHGRGIGTLIVRQLQEEARALKLPIHLVFYRLNSRAGEFYSRLGFEVTAGSETFVEMAWRGA